MSIEESCLAELEKCLANDLFIKGAHPTQEDVEKFPKFVKAKCVPDQENFPQFGPDMVFMVFFEDFRR